MSSEYVNNLIKTVIYNSESDEWKSVVQEWYIIDGEEDQTLSESCIYSLQKGIRSHLI